jgi:site-specific DNA-methyltransferase (adenine-specific)
MPVKIINGNVFDVLPTLPEKSFNTCITSPPYFGLRDYGMADQLGLEPTPDEYISNMVKVFREVKRVLRDDGTLWLNIGDSYCNSNGFARASPEYQREGRNNMPANDRKLDKLHEAGLKTKDLIGIPWMLAFALRADGWYLRQDIIWHKPNPMPESVEDRCTKAHEYIFLLSKSPQYYFDHEAIKEVSVDPESHKGMKKRSADKREGDPYFATKVGNSAEGKIYDKRNKRSVWTVTTKPFKEAHFAVFPEDLIIPCILAGSPERGNILDPFGGSGTTGVVANGFGRDATLVELNPEYAAIAKDRIGMFAIQEER